ncbi:hypothetical protein O23A_p4086 [Aeromonas salmonicida]|nr:hypothetical protein O23A_p4086 [Aeromonas salmonicida]
MQFYDGFRLLTANPQISMSNKNWRHRNVFIAIFQSVNASFVILASFMA